MAFVSSLLVAQGAEPKPPGIGQLAALGIDQWARRIAILGRKTNQHQRPRGEGDRLPGEAPSPPWGPLGLPAS